MANLSDGRLTHPLNSSALTREEAADGFQIAGFISPALRNLHLEKACLLVEHRAQNVSFHTNNKAKTKTKTKTPLTETS